MAVLAGMLGTANFKESQKNQNLVLKIREKKISCSVGKLYFNLEEEKTWTTNEVYSIVSKKEINS
jgi:hypothetical protein